MTMWLVFMKCYVSCGYNIIYKQLLLSLKLFTANFVSSDNAPRMAETEERSPPVEQRSTRSLCQL